jgi:hypothetical protein
MVMIVVLAVVVGIMVRMGGGRLDDHHGGRRGTAARQAARHQADADEHADWAGQPTMDKAAVTGHRRGHLNAPLCRVGRIKLGRRTGHRGISIPIMPA